MIPSLTRKSEARYFFLFIDGGRKRERDLRGIIIYGLIINYFGKEKLRGKIFINLKIGRQRG